MQISLEMEFLKVIFKMLKIFIYFQNNIYNIYTILWSTVPTSDGAEQFYLEHQRLLTLIKVFKLCPEDTKRKIKS